MSTKKGKPKITKGKPEQSYVREQLRQADLAQSTIAQAAGVNQSNISKFMAGKTNLSDEAMESLYTAGIVKRPDSQDLIESGQDAPPLAEWYGELKSVRQVANDKGYSPATIRRYCKTGKLNYVKNGRRYHVAIDEKYKALKETEVARLRRENAYLRAENAKLQRKVTQMEMDFKELETEAQASKNAESPSFLDADFYDVAIAYSDNVVKSVRVAPRYAINASEVVWKMQRLNGCPTECQLRFQISRLEQIVVQHDKRLVVFPVSFEGVLWERGSEVIEKRQDVIER